MPVMLKTAVVAATLACNPVPYPVVAPVVTSVVSAPISAPITPAPKKIVVASKLSYEEELMKKYNELKELENHWNR